MHDSLDNLGTGHILLLYDNEVARNLLISKYVNEALLDGHLVVIAAVDNIDSEYLSHLYHSRSGNKVKSTNPIRLNISQCYNNILDGDFEGVDKMKNDLEQILAKHSSADISDGVVLIIGNCAENLTLEERYEECNILESFLQYAFESWEALGFRLLLICPHLTTILAERERRVLGKSHTAIAIC